MFKKQISLISLLSLIFSLTAPAVLAQTNGFSDVDSSTKYQNSILDLQERGIIEGYPDGSFGPEKNLNRAELTKIVLESLNLGRSSETLCFPDVQTKEWYVGYVCKAKQLGWIQGYPDGLFKPDQTINRAEATKIIAKAAEWKTTTPSSNPYPDTATNEWYATYVDYGKNHAYLPFTTTFQPAQAITRAEFSEIFHRILVTKENNASVYRPEFSGLEESTNTNEEETPTNDQNINVGEEISPTTNVNEDSTYEINTFSNIQLNSELPSKFYKDEVYMLSGKVVSGNYNQVFAFIYPKNNNKNITIFSIKTTGQQFNIPVYFKQSGDYYIGIIPGESGSSKVAPISIAENLPATDNAITKPSAPATINLSYERDKTTINYGSSATLNRVLINQGNSNVTYFNRQGLTSLPLQYKDFVNFNKGTINVRVESSYSENPLKLATHSDWAISSSANFTVTKHQFSEVKNDITINQLPTHFTSGQQVEVSGTTTVALSSKLSVIKPDGTVEDQNTAQSNIAPNSNFKFYYTPATSGTYILEINDTSGVAVINHPIYPTGQIPLIPDFFDINPLKLDTDNGISGSAESSSLLGYINAFRNEQGLPSVDSSSTLNELARVHNQDMFDNNYFSHVNLDGKSPNDRRYAAGINAPVGENIAKTTSTEHGHEGLIRSAIHRSNILDPYWTQVGISILKNSAGYFYINQEFSTSFDQTKETILTKLNNSKQTDAVVSTELATTAQNWSQLMVDNDFVNTTHNGQSIFDTLPEDNNFGSYKVFIIAAGNIGKIANDILETSQILDEAWPNIGIGMAIDKNGAIKTTVLIAK